MTQAAPGRHYRDGISLIELFERFPDDRAAEQWFEQERWGETGLCCPRCGGVDRCSETPNRQPMPYWCGACRKRFSVRTGTILERSKIPLQKWAIGIFLHLSNLKGVSSMKLHRDLKITQKSAWFMLHRIRHAYETAPDLLAGPVEVDETYIGGLEKNKHEHKKLHAGRGTVGKAVVAGVKDRETKEVRAEGLHGTHRDSLQGFVGEHVEPGAAKYTDTASAYQGLSNHATCQHSVGKWVDGQAHANGMESFWVMLKRGYHGVYHRLSVQHLHRYLAEFAGRHNVRDKDTIDQMRHVFAGRVGKRLMYQTLVEGR